MAEYPDPQLFGHHTSIGGCKFLYMDNSIPSKSNFWCRHKQDYSNLQRQGGRITVKSNNACGSSGTQSLSVSMSACAATTITTTSQTFEEMEMLVLAARILPNPSSTYFTLVTQSSGLKPLNVRVMDALGKILLKEANAPANGRLTFRSSVPSRNLFCRSKPGQRE